MAFQLSPGVNVSEIDLTGFIPAVATTGGGTVGQFQWGPVEEYTTIQNKKQLEQIFGKPTDTNYRDWFSASNFLDYSNNLNVIRVVDINAKNSVIEGTDGLLVKNETLHSTIIGTASGDAAVMTARYPGVLGNSLKVILLDSGSWDDPSMDNYRRLFDAKPGTSEYVATVGGSNDEIHVVIEDEDGLFTGTPGAILETFAFVSKASDAIRLDGEPAFYGSVINKRSRYVWFMDVPDSSNMSDGGAISLITVTDGGSGYTSVPDVVITETTTGTQPGAGATATATLANVGELSSVTITDGGTGYATGDTVTITQDNTGATADATVAETGGVIDTLTISNPTATFNTTDSLVITGGTGTGATADVDVVTYAVDSVTVTDGGSSYTQGNVTITFTNGGGSGTTADATVVGEGTTKWDTPSNNANFETLFGTYTRSFAYGVDSTNIDEQELTNGWDMFKNAEIVDVSLLILGDAGEGISSTSHDTVVKYVVDNVASYRKDCVAFFSPSHSDVVGLDENTALQNVLDTRNNINTVSSYAFMDSGWKYQYDLYNDKYRWIPLNADMAGLCAATDLARDPWYSPAGYTRGQIKNAIKLAFNPQKGSRDELYRIGVNPVVSFVGEGTLLYGDKTQLAKPSAFQKLNIRRLFIVLEKAIAKAAKYQLFEFNDVYTRSNFVSQVEPYLRDVMGRRGINDFKVVCDETNNTPEIIDRSEFVADIYIKPNYSINFIQLNFIAVRNGVDFEEVIGVASTNI
jgi:phage tail sheath protein FI